VYIDFVHFHDGIGEQRLQLHSSFILEIQFIFLYLSLVHIAPTKTNVIRSIFSGKS
jgi:hypothetical protein